MLLTDVNDNDDGDNHDDDDDHDDDDHDDDGDDDDDSNSMPMSVQPGCMATPKGCDMWFFINCINS